MSRVLTQSEAAAWAADLREAGGRLVLTNGVFDLLHPGHARYLQAARDQGDALIVAINSDRSVRGNKGPGRPLVPQAERAEVLAALDCVNAVVIFDDPTPADIVRLIRPHVLVKGADWAADAIVGRDTVEALGGKVVRIPIEPGWSTTEIVAKVRQQSN